MSLRITVLDEQTGDTDTFRIAAGDYGLVVAEPCYVSGTQVYPGKGTVVVTIKDHRPQPLPDESEAT